MPHFVRHEVRQTGNACTVYLYMNRKDTEFSEELGTKSHQNEENLKKSARSYVSKNFPHLKQGTIKIMLGSMLVSTTAFGAGGAMASTTNTETTNPDTTVQTTDETETTTDTGDETVTDTTGEPVVETDDETAEIDDGTVIDTDDEAAEIDDGTVIDTDDEAAEIDDGTVIDTDDEAAETDDGTVIDTDDEAAETDDDEDAAPVLVPKDAADFKDIDEDHEFYPYIKDLADRGIIKGVAEDRFGVNDTVTRAQAAKIIALTAGFDVTNIAENPQFKDVVKNGSEKDYSWAYPYVAALENAGVIKGYENEDGTKEFRPNERITREQMAKMLVNAFELADVNETNNAANWSDEYIQVLIDQGITSKASIETFGKANSTTRGHLAKFAYESEQAYLNLFEIEEEADVETAPIDEQTGTENTPPAGTETAPVDEQTAVPADDTAANTDDDTPAAP
jgi:hypothetical protein